MGADNFFLFGLTTEQVGQLRAKGYRPCDYYERDDELREALDLIASGAFAGGDTDVFRPLIDHLLYHDTYFLLADYRAYVDEQAEVDRAFHDTSRWTRMSILNTARAGKFSSDRSIAEYCSTIWRTPPVPVQLNTPSLPSPAIAGKG